MQRTVVRAITRSAALLKRTIPPLRTNREEDYVISFLEPTTDLSTTAFQPITTSISESEFALDEGSTDHTYSCITVDQDSTTHEVLHSDRDEEQILMLDRSNNRSPSAGTQTRYGRPRDMLNVDGTILANLPGWQTGNPLICNHCYTPGHLSPNRTHPLNKIRSVVANYEKLTYD